MINKPSSRLLPYLTPYQSLLLSSRPRWPFLSPEGLACVFRGGRAVTVARCLMECHCVHVPPLYQSRVSSDTCKRLWLHRALWGSQTTTAPVLFPWRYVRAKSGSLPSFGCLSGGCRLEVEWAGEGGGKEGERAVTFTPKELWFLRGWKANQMTSNLANRDDWFLAAQPKIRLPSTYIASKNVSALIFKFHF